MKLLFNNIPIGINPLFVLITILILLQSYKCDLPVHCLSANIEGNWMIHMGENRYDHDLKCGHKRPDQNLDHYDIDVEKIFKQKYEIAVRLERPDKVLTMNGNKQIGKWTMVYDEGFEFTINNQIFFAFSRYLKVGKFNPTNTDSMETKGYKNMCDKTFIGWYHNHHTNKNWGCYYAEKFEVNDSKLDFDRINYRKIFALSKIPKKGKRNNNNEFNNNNNEEFNENNLSQNRIQAQKLSALNNLKKNFYLEKQRKLEMEKKMNKNEMNSNRKRNFMSNNNNDRRKNDDNLNDYGSENPNNINNNKKLKSEEEMNLNMNTNNMDSNNNNNGNINLSYNDISYTDFINSMGWTKSKSSDSQSSEENEIPHLDIFFSDNNEKSNSEFLETESSMKLFEPDNNYVHKINNPENKYTWTAKVYDDFTGKSYSSMRNLLGGINYLKSINKNQSALKEVDKSFLEMSSVFSLSMKSKESSYEEDDGDKDNENEEIERQERETKVNNKESKYGKMPKSFDWRNVDGTNYDSPIRKQGECGSCYAIAAVSVLESRIQIKSNNRLKPVLSPSSVISCSRYNQGCFGGYPYLVGKFAKEYGFVEESCQPYSEVDDKCYDYCFHAKKYKAKDYGYVGGYYGGCDEESMMKEIYENGPIVVAINATPELYYYSKGIFHSDVKKLEGSNEKNVKPWESTNHAIVCVGWGEEIVKEETVKYWILKNSWGETWGENGYFKLKKGLDMASVEAQGVFLIPEMD